MKKKVRLLISLFAVFCILFAHPLTANATQAESIDLVITTDQDTYTAEAAISIEAAVKNNYNFPLEGISVEIQLPEDLVLRNGEVSEKDITLQPGETKTVGISAGLKEQSNWVLWLFIGSCSLLLLGGGLAILLVVLHRKKAARAVSLLLCIAMSLTMLPADSRATQADVATVTAEKAITIDGDSYTVKATATISAEALSHLCTVTFDSKGGSDVEKQTIAKGSAVTIPQNPTNGDLYFIAWYSDEALTTEFDFSTLIYKDCTLYARWVDLSDPTDTDSDGLTDPYEACYKTDPQLADTDGDELNDYIEVSVLNSDPLKQDSDDNGVPDGQEDPDQDGLTNLEEIALGTDPLLSDTDSDTLFDKDELDTYKTDPTLYDTDSDGASDGKEIELGTDPLTADSTFHTTVTANAEEDSVTPSVEINLSGEQVETLQINAVNNTLFFPETMPGYMGKAYDFSVEGTFDSATIRFTFDTSGLSADADPVIFYFNEETQQLEELETTVSGNVASTTVTHFSKYILIDRKIYDESFTWVDVWDNTKNYADAEIILVIDDSGSLGGDYNYIESTGTFDGGKDPAHKRLEVARDFVDSANENTKIGIVKFDHEVVNMTGSLVTCNADGKATLKSILQFTYAKDADSSVFDSMGKTYMYSGIEEAIYQFTPDAEDTLKTIIVFTDGNAHDEHMHNSVIQQALERDVKIHTVGLGTSSSYFRDYLQPLATNTAGSFYEASHAEQLSEIYENIKVKIDISTDSDEDGIPDYYEENMIIFNGVRLTLDKHNPDSDGDGIPDGKEVELIKIENEDKTQVKVIGKVVLGDPTKADTDGDSYKDGEDLRPLDFYKAPVILLHGWNSNTVCFGVNTGITDGDNDHFDRNWDWRPDDTTKSGLSYAELESHRIIANPSGKLGKALMGQGYVPNKNLFAFNYPNIDMVQYNAAKLQTYVDKLVTDALTKDTSTFTDYTYLFPTQEARENKQLGFILIGHSMGGLVSRYYVENLGGAYISKIITIDTPHYGSGLGTASNIFDIAVVFGKFNPAVYDLDIQSTLYGGRVKTMLDEPIFVAGRETQYAINNQSPALKGNKNTEVKYYAIAGYHIGGITEINQLAPELKAYLENGGAFAVELQRDTTNEKAFDAVINKSVGEASLSVYGANSYLDLDNANGDDTVDYLSQLAVRFGDNYDYQNIERSSMILVANPDSILPKWHIANPYHNGILLESKLYNEVIKFIND